MATPNDARRSRVKAFRGDRIHTGGKVEKLLQVRLNRKADLRSHRVKLQIPKEDPLSIDSSSISHQADEID
jgi:hypothetical protein